MGLERRRKVVVAADSTGKWRIPAATEKADDAQIEGSTAAPFPRDEPASDRPQLFGLAKHGSRLRFRRPGRFGATAQRCASAGYGLHGRHRLPRGSGSGQAGSAFADSGLGLGSRHQHIFLVGPTGIGKTYLARAFGQKASRDGFTAYFSDCQRQGEHACSLEPWSLTAITWANTSGKRI